MPNTFSLTPNAHLNDARFLTSPSLPGSVCIQEYGHPSAETPTLVCVHGWLQSQECWSAQTGPLSPACHLVTFDLPGHGIWGDIKMAASLSVNDWVESLHLVLQEVLRKTQKVILMGWSIGGLAISKYLQRYGTDGLQGLILIGSHLSTPFLTMNSVSMHLIQTIIRGDPQQAQHALHIYHSALTRWPLEPESHERSFGYNTLAFHRLSSAGASIFEDVLTESDLDAVIFHHLQRVPVLIIHGRDDELVPLQNAYDLAERLPNALLRVYPNCGHSPFLEVPAAFNCDVISFLKTLTTSS